MPQVETSIFHGLPAIRLHANDGSTATITLQGAHVVSWTDAQGLERLYLSPTSRFEAGQAIRGGVPVIFPQFSMRGPLPRHGFARTAAWTVVDAPQASADCRVTLRLCSNADTRALWPHAFVCELTVALEDDHLCMRLEVSNPGTTPFSFQAALHTYLAVGAIGSVRLSGLENCVFEDTTQAHGPRAADPQTVLHIDGTTDRIYYDTPSQLGLQSDHGALALEHQGFCDVVVWNPGKTGEGAFADLPLDGYQHFVCVEAALIGRACELGAGECWVGVQTLGV